MGTNRPRVDAAGFRELNVHRLQDGKVVTLSHVSIAEREIVKDTSIHQNDFSKPGSGHGDTQALFVGSESWETISDEILGRQVCRESWEPSTVRTLIRSKSSRVISLLLTVSSKTTMY